MPDQDVFVVGAGPAGLAAAIAARAKGFRVTVADPRVPPIDKACGEGLMPDALDALRALGVEPPAAGSFPFRGIRFVGAGGEAAASFPRGHGLGVRRTALHQLLVQRAEQAGVSLLWGTRVSDLSKDGVFVDHRRVACRWVIGADGQESRVRRWAGLERFERNRCRFGFRRHYQVRPWTDCMEIYWGRDCQIYVTPVAPEEVCVVLISRDRRLRLDAGLAQFPEVLARLKDALPGSAERGAVTASRILPAVCRGRVALVGDASGSVDAVTGEGLRLAFLQARSLAAAMERGDLAPYQAEHRRMLSRPTTMGSLMLALDRHGWLRRRVLKTFAAKPSLFERMLAVHVGEVPPAEFGLARLVALGCGVLTSL